MYTLIATAKLNNIDPQAWLADVLRRIADHPAPPPARASPLELARAHRRARRRVTYLLLLPQTAGAHVDYAPSVRGLGRMLTLKMLSILENRAVCGGRAASCAQSMILASGEGVGGDDPRRRPRNKAIQWAVGSARCSTGVPLLVSSRHDRILEPAASKKAWDQRCALC